MIAREGVAMAKPTTNRPKGLDPAQLGLWVTPADARVLRPLPLPGADVRYAPTFLDGAEAAALFDALRRDAPWEAETVVMYDREIPVPRLHAGWAFGADDAWGAPLERLRQRVEAAAGAEFDVVRLILYRDGRDSLAWHADREAFAGRRPIVASLSLGATRRFLFRPKPGQPGERLALDLPAGSLLVMAEGTQERWEHAVPKTARPVGERINLTFRQVRRGE